MFRKSNLGEGALSKSFPQLVVAEGVAYGRHKYTHTHTGQGSSYTRAYGYWIDEGCNLGS